MFSQSIAVRSKGIGFDDLSAGSRILKVNRLDHFRLREIQLLEAPLVGYAACIELSAHPTIT